MDKHKEEDLAKWLAEIETGRKTRMELHTHAPELAGELDALLDSIGELRALPEAVPSDAFRRNARIRVLNRARTLRPIDLPARATRMQVVTFQLRRVLAVMTILVAFLVGGGIMAVSTQNALPGDLLYSAKLNLESLQLLAAGPGEDVILQSRFANNRLTEIQILIVQERYDDVNIAVARFEENVDGSLLALAQVARSGGSATYPMLLRIEGDLKEYANILALLQTFVPEETQLVLARAIEISRVRN